MIEFIILGIFSLIMLLSILLSIPLLLTLAIGYLLFFGYGLYKKHGVKELLTMSKQGLDHALPVLITFIIIGMLTAVWRASGTLEAITFYSAGLINPFNLICMSFLLCSLASMLTGSSFASAATMGVASYFIAKSLGLEGPVIGGAILAGCFVGDRCSPLSTALLLISNLTETPLFENVKRVLKSAAVPFVLSCLIYLTMSILAQKGSVSFAESQASIARLQANYLESFTINFICLLPAVLIVVLSLFKVNMKINMLCSLALALIIAVTLQHFPIAQVPALLLFGYKATNPAIANMVNGGGIESMAELILIVSLASTYSGLFDGTGLLQGLSRYASKLARKTTPFTAVLMSSLGTSMIACDQIVAIMLTAQLCKNTERTDSALAMDLACSAQILPALIPWSTSVLGISTFVGLPISSILFAFFCILVPAWTLGLSLYVNHNPHFIEHRSTQLISGLDERDCQIVFKNAA